MKKKHKIQTKSRTKDREQEPVKGGSQGESYRAKEEAQGETWKEGASLSASIVTITVAYVTICEHITSISNDNRAPNWQHCPGGHSSKRGDDVWRYLRWE